MSRLSTDRTHEIFVATLELVATRGFASTTMDAIADRAHCSKATLYRQWETKAGLVVDALHTLKPHHGDLPDSGSLRDDLHALVHARMDQVHDGGQLVVAILHAASQDDELREALMARMTGDGQRSEAERLIERAVARGEIPADLPALRYLPLIFMAPMVLHPMLPDRKLDASLMTDYLDATLIPLLGLTAD